jgi:hypothetical protein
LDFLFLKNHFKEDVRSQAPVDHSYNPSYSGSRDQKDCGSIPAQVNSLQDPILKIPNTKKGLAEWLE